MPTRRPASWAVILTAVVILAACDAGPVMTGPPAVGNPTSAPSPGSPAPSEARFSPASWPAGGSACGREGYRGNLGRIEATEARTVVFTLCAPDGAFLSRVAHPALGVLDAATIDELATDSGSARSLAGTGPYRIDQWTRDQNVRLVRAGDAASAVDASCSNASCSAAVMAFQALPCFSMAAMSNAPSAPRMARWFCVDSTAMS